MCTTLVYSSWSTTSSITSSADDSESVAQPASEVTEVGLG